MFNIHNKTKTHGQESRPGGQVGHKKKGRFINWTIPIDVSSQNKEIVK
jgi:hypothetical protein